MLVASNRIASCRILLLRAHYLLISCLCCATCVQFRLIFAYFPKLILLMLATLRWHASCYSISLMSLWRRKSGET